jgi:hypothetical protein
MPRYVESLLITIIELFVTDSFSQIVLDYGEPSNQLLPEAKIRFDKRSNIVSTKEKEPWLSFYTVDEMRMLLRSCSVGNCGEQQQCDDDKGTESLTICEFGRDELAKMFFNGSTEWVQPYGPYPCRITHVYKTNTLH